VRDLVKLEDVVVSEGLSANVALVRLLSRVRPHVHAELFAAGEALTAHLASVGFLA